MIKNLASSSAYITVSGSYPPAIYNNGQLNVGQIRYNPNSQNMEVYDGNTWQLLSQGTTVGLSYEADSAIRWAIEKEKEERSLKERMAKHPGLKDAYERFQMMDILTKESDKIEQE
jgi:hypothetical protein